MFQLLANLLAFFYSLIPNYAIAIALLTLTVMLVLSPLTVKSTRSMLAMQKLQPEIKALQAKHKGGDRQKLNEEMMALYKEHKVNPVAGCLPMLLQAPVFIILYNVIRGLSHDDGPKYLDHGSKLYKALIESGGTMKSFGIDLANSASEKHGSFGKALPFFIIVALVGLTQYYQTRQTMSRSTAQSSPQQQIMLKVLPAVFVLISLGIPAAVNVYFLVSALFRVAQTGAMYRWDPHVSAHAKRHATEVAAKSVEVKQPKREAKAKEIPIKNGKSSGNGTKPSGGSPRAQAKGTGSSGRRPPPRPPKRKKGR